MGLHLAPASEKMRQIPCFVTNTVSQKKENLEKSGHGHEMIDFNVDCHTQDFFVTPSFYRIVIFSNSCKFSPGS